jgi:hypothetical protein
LRNPNRYRALIVKNIYIYIYIYKKKKNKKEKKKERKKEERVVVWPPSRGREGWQRSHPDLDRVGRMATLTNMGGQIATVIFLFHNKLAPISAKVKHLFCQNIPTKREEYRFNKSVLYFEECLVF